MGVRAKDDFVPELFKIGQQAGFTKESFDECLARPEAPRRTSSPVATARGTETFGVNSTPTFFINGKRLAGGSLEDFEKALAPLLKG